MIIGIDPDCVASGVAVKNTPESTLLLYDLDFWGLFQYLKDYKELITLVRIEASWLIGGNWHTKTKGTAALNASIGSRTGANHQTGKLIVDMCKFLNIPFEEVKPLKKIWKGTGGKISKAEFVAITNWKGAASQEVRDAYLLIHKLN
ncbi:hypothetical protein [Flavobacterium psychrophilum]|uniref:Uncharacterized protein n=1 Tax=Flavobacterium psychrophilum TaxID=96345 RepID=A0A7U2NE71_FLAPS|nr:hypothetical protein [Flavobacterium psychrophilum]QRE03494.1 hypothetical protein H0H26_11475 [Flavobacterium psychrophilum]